MVKLFYLVFGGFMNHKYTARIYLEKDEVEDSSGDDLDELYAWMLSRAEGTFGNIHGDIIENATKEVVRQFRKSPPD